MNEEAEKHNTSTISSDEFVIIKNFGMFFVKYNLYLAIVINIEIKIDSVIRVFDIMSIDDSSEMLFSVVYGGINNIFIISSVIVGIKICQYILNIISIGMHISVKMISSIY